MCGGICAGYHNVANRGDADLHFIVHFQKEGTWVLYAPLLIGHIKTRARLDFIAALFNRQRQRNVMAGAMDKKHALHLYARCSLVRDFPRHMRGRKCDFRIALALQNLFVHFLVASMIAALAACRIHNDFAAGVARFRVECDAATSHFEGAVDGVQNVPQRPLDLGLGSIEIDRYLLCRRHRRQQH